MLLKCVIVGEKGKSKKKDKKKKECGMLDHSIKVNQIIFKSIVVGHHLDTSSGKKKIFPDYVSGTSYNNSQTSAERKV